MNALKPIYQKSAKLRFGFALVAVCASTFLITLSQSPFTDPPFFSLLALILLILLFPEFLFSAATIASISNRAQLATSLCKLSLELRPENPAALRSLSIACMRLGLIDEAKEHIDRAIELDRQPEPE